MERDVIQLLRDNGFDSAANYLEDNWLKQPKEPTPEERAATLINLFNIHLPYASDTYKVTVIAEAIQAAIDADRKERGS